MASRKPIVKQTNNRKKCALACIGAVVILLGTVLLLELTNTTHIFHNQKPVQHVTAGQNTKGEVSDAGNTPAVDSGHAADTPTSPDNTPSQDDNKKDTNGGAPTTALVPPTGNFVSAHKVPRSASISSVCNTTVGATCQISFTLNGVTKSLDSQTTDKEGAAYWNSWTPANLGITKGTWKIQAVATLGGQTQRVDDALNLEVSE